MTTHLGHTRPGTGVGRLLAGLVRLAGGIAAVLIVGHILLTFFGADPANTIARFFASASAPLTQWFQGLFAPATPHLALIVNEGLAAVFWLVVAGIVAAIVHPLD